MKLKYEIMRLKCEFCGKNCQMTARDNSGTLHQCCNDCYVEKKSSKNRLWVSLVFKEVNEE